MSSDSLRSPAQRVLKLVTRGASAQTGFVPIFDMGLTVDYVEVRHIKSQIILWERLNLMLEI